MNKKYTSVILFLSIGTSLSFGQNGNIVREEKKSDNHTPTFVEFVTSSKLSDANSSQIINEHLQAGRNTDFRITKKTTDDLGFTHITHQQYFKGVKVENGVYIAHSRNNVIETMGGDYIALEDNFNTVPKLSEQAALTFAKKSVDATEYMWQTEDATEYYSKINGKYMPKGELVIVENFNATTTEEKIIPHLAYKFDIYATQPVSRAYIFVDATTGAILLSNSIIHHVSASGTMATRFSGTKSGQTDLTSGTYKLKDYTRGQGIETFNLKKKTMYNRAVDFVDGDNNWTATEYHNATKDDAAFDVHLGLQNTYDYFKNVHNRKSYDNANSKMKAYVHYSNNYVNAFWDGSKMTYGDGDGINYDPLTSQDVTSHELGHGVCQYTANLTYSNESGALNEAFSDIWGACVEYAYFPTKKTWYVGDDFDLKNHKGFRNMANPNEFGDPDTYKGTNWYSGTSDNGGVHTNSGVFNYCFYLLAVGGTGTNDIGNAFSVASIGITDAARIFYRAESVYMTSATNYAGARTACIQAAKDLFGVGSQQEISTTNAFYAVGVSGAYVAPLAGGTTSPSGAINFGINENAEQLTGVHTILSTIKAIEIFPNPSKETIRIRCNASTTEDHYVSFYDVVGRLQLQRKLNFVVGINESVIDVSDLPRGNYFVKITSATNPSSSKESTRTIVLE